MGALGWAPETFWAATPRDLAAAVRGKSGKRKNAVSREDVARLKKWMEEDQDADNS